MNDEALQSEIQGLLWDAVEGSSVAVEDLRAKLRDGDNLYDAGVDSLDMTEFLLRVQDHYGLKFSQEDYATLNSLQSVYDQVRGRLGGATGPGRE